MATEENEKIRIILGSMEFGRRCDQEASEKMVDLFVNRGYTEVDTALMYTGGTSETWIGEMLKKGMKFSVATKANPWGKNNLKTNGVKSQMGISLQRLQSDSVDLFYLHAPDHDTDIEETLAAVNELHQKKKFREFGLSNYPAWKVMEIYYICKQNGYVLPTVYQGMYNPLTRDVEPELFPTLRRCGMRFYAYNPLAGGILSGKHSFKQVETNEVQTGRFDLNQGWAQAYRNRFWKIEYFQALDLVKAALIEEFGNLETCTCVEATFRFMTHHMKLNSNDGIILGASSLAHFGQNIDACEKGPLPEKVVNAFEEGWNITKKNCIVYFR